MVSKIKFRSKVKGVTFIELLIVMVIASIILSQALPSYRQFSLRQEISNISNSLLVDMMYMRTTAVNTGQQLTILANAEDDWSKGWVVFADKNHNSILDNSEKELRISQKVSGNIIITSDVSFIVINSIGGLVGNIPTLVIGHNEVDKTIYLKTNRSGLATLSES